MVFIKGMLQIIDDEFTFYNFIEVNQLNVQALVINNT